MTRIEGFPTSEIERNGKKRLVGPSEATLGEGVVYIGNRGDSSVCIVDELKLTKGACATLDSMPDCIAFVAKTNELWITTPKDKSVRILDAVTLVPKAKLTFAGSPEGVAVDAKRGRFYTNLEDLDATLAIDLVTHQTLATWKPDCGKEGPHGLRVDESGGYLFVACSDKAKTLDAAHDGAIISSIDVGDGVDDLDFAAASRSLYAAGGKSATLTIAQVDAKGGLSVTEVVPTKEGARNSIIDQSGRIYLTHSKGSELVLLTPRGAPTSAPH